MFKAKEIKSFFLDLQFYKIAHVAELVDALA